jgi:glyoxylase-like metal-dependent hydrolase (beta-lactamase superfamily II)
MLMLRLIVALVVLLAVVTAVGILRSPRPPEGVERYSRYYLSDRDRLQEDAIRVTSFGATTLLFDDGATRFLVDAFFTRPALAGGIEAPVQTDTAVVRSVLARAGIERLDAIFVAHSHYDHVLDVAE